MMPVIIAASKIEATPAAVASFAGIENLDMAAAAGDNFGMLPGSWRHGASAPASYGDIVATASASVLQ